MTSVYVLCFVAFMTQELGRSVVLAGSADCQWVAAAIRKDSCWYVDKDRQVLQWYRPPFAPPSQKSVCFCDPLVGGLGNISRIDVIAGKGKKSTSNTLCSGCVGVEVPVTDYSFSPDDPLHGQGSQTFGPCDGITVYRCNCPKPGTPTVTIPTTVAPTKPEDPYSP